MKDFRKLKVWQHGHRFALEIYRITKDFPREEMYGLTSQIRRSCASIATNIAEGCGRATDADLARFLHIALGSASEVEYQLILSHDLGYLTEKSYVDLLEQAKHVKQMLGMFIKKLKAEGG